MLSLYARAAIIPGRSLTRSKAPDRLIRDWAVSAEGATITGASGQTYLDMLGGLAGISLGYPASVYSLPSIYEILAAEAVLQYVTPWASHVRFLKTGSEACHAAYRIAKAATGRANVLVGDWSYHGWHEWCSPSPHQFKHGADLRMWQPPAAVFIEPHRWEPVSVEWLHQVRAFCDRIGALLVFDSMVYGGRWAIGGASEYFGVTPDLECFGKALGGGEAVAFVVGRDAMRDYGELASGTYSGDVRGLKGIVDTVARYRFEPIIETLWARGKQLRAVLTDAVKASGWEGEAFVEGSGDPHLRLRFTETIEQPTRSAYDYKPVGPEHRPRAWHFKAQMAARGIIWHPDCVNVMYAHTEAQIEQVGVAAFHSLMETPR